MATDSPIMVDGSLSFDGGVDSLKPTTVASQHNPNGLQRNQLAWMINATCRDGGISPRAGWQPLYQVLSTQMQTAFALAGGGIYQGGWMYEPLGANPYMVISIGGRIFLLDPAAKSPVNLSDKFNLFNPPEVEHGYFCQGEQFLVIQAGDGITLPLFWDGATLRRSVGLNPPTSVAPVTSLLISHTVQSGTVPISLSSLSGTVGLGGQITLTWPSIGTLVVGTNVIMKGYQSDNNGPSFGSYVVSTIAGNTVTMNRTDFNAAPLNFSNIDMGLYYASAPPSQPQPVIIRELPPGYAMDYYMGRIWYVYVDQRTYTAGDIVGNAASGTQPYNFTDSILKVTENPLAIGGDGFHIPANSGNIRSLTHTANLNASLGQGQLYISTRKQIYALTVPVSRSDWISANTTNQPLQTVVQINNGTTGDRCVVGVNGDLYYQSLEPGIRSLVMAVRYFDQPGNVPISSPENRILQFNNRELLSFATGIEFDNRLLQSALPKRTPQGIVHGAVLPLDFTPLNEPGSTAPPVWEGHYEGLDILQMFTGDFGGLQRAFAVVVSKTDQSVWLWELTQGSLTENGDNRITWQIEFPAFTWGEEFDLKKLVGGEIWIDRLSGTAEFSVEYRQDGSACYIPWVQWKECSARDCNELIPPSCPVEVYPVTKPLGLGYRDTRGFPKPPVNCDRQMARPSDTAHQFQVRLTIKGSCRVRGIFLHATKVERKLYANLPC